MKPCRFYVDGDETELWDGFTSDKTWNGWDVVALEAWPFARFMEQFKDAMEPEQWGQLPVTLNAEGNPVTILDGFCTVIETDFPPNPPRHGPRA